jgi:uncharacterized repeat protein (TIGR02543 family)
LVFPKAGAGFRGILILPDGKFKYTNYVEKPTKADSVFLGYNTKQNGTGATIIDGAGYITSSNFDSEATLYAKYASGHNILYYNTSGAENINKDGCVDGETFKLQPIAKDGYAFDGWTIGESAGGAAAPTGDIACAGGLKYYANWTACGAGQYLRASDNTCQSCVEGSYSSGAANKSCTACQGGKTTSGAGQSSCNADCPPRPGSWISLVWENDNTINPGACATDSADIMLTFDKKGGTGGTNSEVTYPGAPEIPSITCPVKTGYNFVGYWDMRCAKQEQWYGASCEKIKSSVDATSDLTLRARWKPTAAYGQIANVEYSHELLTRLTNKMVSIKASDANQAVNMNYLLKLVDVANNGQSSYYGQSFSTNRAANVPAVDYCVSNLICE